MYMAYSNTCKGEDGLWVYCVLTYNNQRCISVNIWQGKVAANHIIIIHLRVMCSIHCTLRHLLCFLPVNKGILVKVHHYVWRDA